jgi:guanidinopropionase
MSERRPRSPGDAASRMLVPRIYGGTPSLFGAPVVEREEDLAGADLAFFGIPWRAPTPDSRVADSTANYEGTLLTPAHFRANSIKYGGYLPELDVDVFDHFRLVDCGDVDVVRDMDATLDNVGRMVAAALRWGARPVTMGGNAGPASYGVARALAAERAPVAMLNLDAHHDNRRREPADDDPRAPEWGSSWVWRTLGLPGIDAARYFHFGLRGPRNDRDVFRRFAERGVAREQIATHREIKAARRAGFEGWAAHVAGGLIQGARGVWVAIDPDVMDLSSNPHFGDEPLGPTTDEVCELLYQVGRAAGREKLLGVSFMALPHAAQTLHYICVYMLLYLLAGAAAA